MNKFLKSLILTILFLSTFPLYSSYTPINTSAYTICPAEGDAYDARCKCDRKQCRLSKLGNPDFADGTDSANRNGVGSFSCFEDGQRISSKPEENGGEINRYRGVYAEFDPADQEQYEKGAIFCPSNNMLIEKEVPMLIERLPDQNGSPCYRFNYAITMGAYQKGEPGIAKGVSRDDLNGSEISGFDQRKWDGDTANYTYEGSGNIFRYCSNQPFIVHQYRGHTEYTPGANDCAARTFTYDPVTSDVIITYPTEENADNVYAPEVDDDWFDEELTDEDSITANERVLPFYTDEFNRLPNAQNVPIGAECVVQSRTMNGLTSYYSFWKVDEATYFKGLGDSSDVCGEGGDTNVLFGEKDIFGNSIGGTPTAFGCLPNSFNGLISFFVRLAVAVSGGVTLLIVTINFIKILGNSSNPDAIAEARKKLVSATLTFLGLIGSLAVLNILGLQILSLDAFGGGILRIFTGG